MENKLNVSKVGERAQELGLSQAKLAEKLEVSREAVSQWFKNEKFPRPDKLLKLARILNLDFGEMVVKIPSPNEPVVAFRKKGGRKITPDYIERARDMGHILSRLVPHLPFDELSQPAILKAPSTDYVYVQKAAKRVRSEIGAHEGDKIEFSSLIRFFNNLYAVIIPVLWGDKDRHENALHIYLPDSMTTWIYLNLDCRLHDFKYWMAHELGHAQAPQLKGDEGEDFAEAFAGALLFPGDLAEREYAQLRRINNIGGRINHIKNIAERLVVSPVTVCYEINKYAAHHQLPAIDLESNQEIHKATSNFNKEFKRVGEYLFETGVPTPAQYIASSKEQFGSPFFDVLKKYLLAEHKSATFVQSVLGTTLADAQAIYGELC